IVTTATEQIVGGHVHGDVQVTRRSAAGARCALARNPQPRAISHSLRHPHGDGPSLRSHAGAQARRAWLIDHLPGALAHSAGLAEAERALVVADEPRTATVGTDMRRSAGLRPDPTAGAAGSRARQLQREGRP